MSRIGEDFTPSSAPVAEQWSARGEGKVACELCPRGCVLADGAAGACRVRVAQGGRLVLPYYGAISACSLDPIEKKPLHHFLPGSEIFSVGFVGCNLRCPFCQNWEISQSTNAAGERLSPRALIEAALRSGSPSIAYTYSEPLVHFEYVRDSMILARAAGLRNVIVTNGCIKEKPAREILALTDAANVDLKCWSSASYRGELGGDLESVLGFVKLAASSCHVEVTTLVVPGLSDESEDISSIAAFLSSLSPDIALHLSAYRPAWKRRDPPTDPALLSSLAARARASLRYVYVGNVVGRDADTACPACGARVIRRRGYSIDASGLRKNGEEAVCAACGARLPIAVLD